MAVRRCIWDDGGYDQPDPQRGQGCGVYGDILKGVSAMETDKRLTYQYPAGKIWLKACDSNCECDEECFYCHEELMERALEKLAAYEETGLTPEEVRALAKR